MSERTDTCIEWMHGVGSIQFSSLTVADGRGAKVKRQWVPDNWSCVEEAPPYKPSCSGSWNKQITALGRMETRIAWIVSDCAGNAIEVGRPSASAAVTELYTSSYLPIPNMLFFQTSF